ncbi:ATP-binding protein [Methylonatrum kenyense]|uniref:sensor histidine kinase n=1 Tax=Methylonatrum kenyense TaxID=455253 RepID=UPI0020BED605|nr:ATP-binding protein [Methylonatrum kenyense]MCK8517185.1 ATP-binding protein [Methylonatrum kenyense]
MAAPSAQRWDGSNGGYGPDLVSPLDITVRYGWQPFRLLALYRLLVAIILLATLFAGVESLLLEPEQPLLFSQLAGVYFLAMLALLVTAQLVQRHLLTQVTLHTITDCILLGLLIYAVGLEDNALAPLLLVSVTGSAVLVPLRLAALYAAVGSLALLFQHLMHYLQFDEMSVGYTAVGLLGAALFLVALPASALGKRTRANALLAERRGVDLANMEALNGHIVERLQDGILVVDGQDRIRLMNRAAWIMTGRPTDTPTLDLGALAPELRKAVQLWREAGTPDTVDLVIGPDRTAVQAHFRPLGAEGAALCVLEDSAEMNARVQQAKLASLGQLTASIAHEIRNPLSGVVHAGQLLAEGNDNPADRRLLDIIQRQSRRLNGIVEDVLRMSRRDPPQPRRIHLKPWLEEFADEVSQQQSLHGARLDIGNVDDELVVGMDSNHLHQVLSNLVQNAVRHGDAGHETRLRLATGHDRAGRPWLEITDNGRGVPPEQAERLFQPFFTTSEAGTGLGLYLCRELCEANGARLTLRTTRPQSACFRVTFARSA